MKTPRFVTTSIVCVLLGLLGTVLQDVPSGATVGVLLESAAERARAHLAAHVEDLGVLPSDVSDLRVTDVYRTDGSRMTHVYLQQRLDGRAVRDGTATVTLDGTGEVLHVAAHLRRDLRGTASGSLQMGPAEAARVAAATVGLRIGADVELRSRSRAGDAAVLSGGRVAAGAIRARVLYEPADDDRLRLAWQVLIQESDHEHWWDVAVDAESGRVLRVDDRVIHEDFPSGPGRGGSAQAQTTPARAVRPPRAAADGATYQVYEMPLESPNDGDRSVAKNAADRAGSPFGWHDTDGKPGHEHTTTQGNNVHAYADYVQGGAALRPAMEADGGEDLSFDFPLDFSQPPYLWREAAVTNLFYWSNVIHDVTYRYGFDEPAGNFQASNYSGKGQGGDAVFAEAQDGSGFDNANFSTGGDGTPGRIQMYVWTRKLPGEPTLVDGDLDSGVIVHEYGHGISIRLTGGPSRPDCLYNVEQAGEGWSDWFALALTTRKSDLNRPRGIGTYVFGQGDRHQTGIRPTPYSTDMKINPATYDTIKTSAIPHGVGYVWATMLWDMYVDLVEKYGFNPNVYESWKTGGNNLAIQLVMDGLKMQPCNPGFVDARDGVLAADRALTGGKNQCLIWRAFARRGLGVGADQGDPTSVSDGKESKTVPRGC